MYKRQHLGFTLAGTFHNCGYKFGRWYDMIWMEKVIGEHRPDQPDIVPYQYCCLLYTSLISALFGSEGLLYASAFFTMFNLLLWTMA